MFASKCNEDTAGGTILPAQVFTRIEAGPWAVVGCPVASHPPCPDDPAHCAASMAEGSSFVRIDGVPVCRAGDSASCGHAATGREWIRVHG